MRQAHMEIASQMTRDIAEENEADGALQERLKERVASYGLFF